MTVLSDESSNGRPDATLALAGEFPRATREEWRALVTEVLRKSGRLPENYSGPVEDLLATELGDGVRVAPLYTAEDAPEHADAAPGVAPYVRGAKPLGANPSGWDVRAQHTDPDPEATAEAIRTDLANGVTSLWLLLGARGLPVESLPTVLEDVPLDRTPIVLDAGADAAAAAETLLALAGQRQLPAEALTGNLGADPFGLLAGVDADVDLDARLRTAGELAKRCVAERPALRAITVDASVYHNAGASDARELGCSLAAGVAYLRALTEAGLSTAQAFGQLEFRYAATADQFATIAKLRAARGLWHRVARECGVGSGANSPKGTNGAAQRQHAVSSEVMVTKRDPWVNLLRGTLAAFGAAAGGADAVTVLPFDAALGLPDSFSRRIARNTQSLLIAEAHLARVIDPAGGSWYVERLTNDLARAAWEIFTGIERAGGLAQVLRDGSLAETLAEAWAARERRLATRKEPILGVSEYPNLTEKLPERPAAPRAATRGRLPKVRRSARFEELRDRADAHTEATGARPAVFLATLGSVASHTARATFAANLFQAGGLATPTGGGTPAEIAEAFTASGAKVACLCGADETYARQAAEVADALRSAGATTILLAGKPSTEGDGGFVGVDEFVYSGCDAIAVLTGIQRTLGVSA